MRVIGIDPGKHSGVAIYDDGKLSDLLTFDASELIQAVKDLAPAVISFEDSRLQTAVFRRNANVLAMRKIARDVGRIDGLCAQIEAAFAGSGVALHKVSPLAKGGKIDAKKFTALTGWAKRCNQHERDAAMVAYKYRNI